MFGGTVFRSAALDELWRFHQQIEGLLGEGVPGARVLASRSFPAVNVSQNAKEVEVTLFAPGIDKEDLKIHLERNLLTVSGERSVPAAEGATSYRKERFEGRFHRAFTLPEDVDPERIEARYRDGLVHIRIQRREAPQPRQIPVQA